jgi:hypothetical protein
MTHYIFVFLIGVGAAILAQLLFPKSGLIFRWGVILAIIILVNGIRMIATGH